jgi:hypothetical protein
MAIQEDSMTLSAPRVMRVPVVLVFAAVLTVTGCAKATPDGGTGPGVNTSTPSGTGAAGSAPASSAPPAASNYTVTYGWAVPSNLVTVPHRVAAPITPPPGIPLPYLVGIYTGNHANENPGYGRISFYFRGGFPEYRFQYVKQVLAEGSGMPVPLTGNAFLGITFVHAQAHDNAGKSTVKDVANPQVGFTNLVSYRPAGDFEGYVSFGLGIRVAANSDQVLPIRVGELSKSDGAGGTLFVVAFDVHSG